MKTNKKSLICAAFVVLIMLIVSFYLYTDKSIVINDNLSEVNLSLLEGEYELTYLYSSDHDFALASYYESNGQRLPIFATVLPATEGEGQFTYKLSLPISIRNNSICFETLEENTAITGIKVKSETFPISAIMALVFYVLFVFLMIKGKYKEKYFLYTSFITLLLEPVFIVNAFIIPIWFVLALSAVFVLEKKGIELGENAKAFALFFAIALLFFEFFTTCSPLFSSNTSFDPNVYYSVGAALAHGKTMYKEVFDQKGPLVSFTFLIGYLITPGYFYGVWIIESISASIGMYLAFRIGRYFTSERISRLLGIATIAVYLNENYLIAGATVEEFMVTIVLAMIYLIIQNTMNLTTMELDSKCTSEKNINATFILLGVLTAIVFFSKYNLSVAFMVASFILWLSLIKSEPLKKAFCYCGGFILVTIPIALYFVVTNSVKAFYHCYFKFNIGYGDVTSVQETFSRMCKNLYEAFCLDTSVTMLIILGLAVLVISSRYMTGWGRIILLTAFLFLCAGQYSSTWIFPYHFMPIVAFAIIGLIVLAMILEKYVLKEEKIVGSRQSEVEWIVAILILGISFINNGNILQSKLVDKDPKKQEVIAQQMNYYSNGNDYSFFELGFLESGIYQAAKKYPEVQYFFLPNIDTEINPEPYVSQVMYIDNAVNDYVIWRGFNDENVPNIEPIDRNYERVATYISEDDEFYMLYKKR